MSLADSLSVQRRVILRRYELQAAGRTHESVYMKGNRSLKERSLFCCCMGLFQCLYSITVLVPGLEKEEGDANNLFNKPVSTSVIYVQNDQFFM